MKCTWKLAAIAATLIGISGLRGNAAADDDGFVSLFNGKDLAGWKAFVNGEGDPSDTFYVKDAAIIVSGKRNGYFFTEKSYKNYRLRFDWRYQRPENLVDEEKFSGNSGLLMHIQPPPKIWPKSIEVQGMNRNHGMIIPVGGAKLIGKAKFNGTALNKARKPVGEWNTTEVTSENGEITARVNGVPISSGKGNLTEGPFGFQSEGAELHFKNIKIKVRE